MPLRRMGIVGGGGASCCGGKCTHAFNHDTLEDLFDANKLWADSMRQADPTFFERLTHQQTPEFLYIGCSDSRVPANQILGLVPGEVFVHRNVGNQALHNDINLMSCLEFGVKSLHVKTVLVVGHYKCGAVRAALQQPAATPGLVNCWISDIREARNQAARELAALDPEAAVARLCELNVLRQTFHVCTSPVVQAAWAQGSVLHVWGMIYDVEDGLIKRLAGPINNESDVNQLRFDGGGLDYGGVNPPPAVALRAPRRLSRL